MPWRESFPPVVGFEELRYQHETLRLGPIPEDAELSLEAVGGCVRLHALTPDGRERAWDLEAPFGVWPPPVTKESSTNTLPGPATVVLEVATWPDGAVLALGPDRAARWVSPDADVRGASFVCSIRDGFDLVIERAATLGGLEIGSVPLGNRYARALVARDGTLVVATAERRDPSVVDIFHVDAQVRCLGSMPCPAFRGLLNLEELLPSEAGAWLLFQRRGTCSARAVDRGGFGIDWTTGFSLALSELDSSARFAVWRDGFAVAIIQEWKGTSTTIKLRLVVLATNGTNTTRALEAPPRATPLPRAAAIVSAADGSGLLVAYHTRSGVVVARADFRESQAPVDPWLSDAKAYARVAARNARAGEASSYPLASTATRREVVERVRLEHMLYCVGAVHVGMPMSHTYEGSLEEGRFESATGNIENIGWGSNRAVLWDRTGVLGLESIHPWPSALRPRRFLQRALPPSLRGLLDRASKLRGFEHGVWAAFWITAAGEGRHKGHGLQELERYLEPPASEFVPVHVREDLDDDTGDLALRLQYAATPHVLDAADERIAFASAGPNELLAIENVESAVAAFKSAGIECPTAVAQVKLRREAELKRRVAVQGPMNAALLVAAHSGDLVGVLGALEAGANIDATSFRDQFPNAVEHSTALVLATRAKHREVAVALIERGADVNRETGPAWGNWRAPETPLRLAACRGDVDLCKRLLARGADVQANKRLYGILWFVGLREQKVTAKRLMAVTRLLLDAGCPLPEMRHRGALIDLAARAGDTELTQRLESEP